MSNEQQPAEYWFESRARAIFQTNPDQRTSRLLETRFNLTHSENLIPRTYTDENDIPTEEGFRFLSIVLTQSLVGVIHLMHQRGYKNDVENLRGIIAELSAGFAEVAAVGEGKWSDPVTERK